LGVDQTRGLSYALAFLLVGATFGRRERCNRFLSAASSIWAPSLRKKRNKRRKYPIDLRHCRYSLVSVATAVLCLQIAYVREWACLDSNQGPLPYQRSTTLCRRFPEFAKSLQIWIFLARSFSRVFQLFTWVAARLLHTGVLGRTRMCYLLRFVVCSLCRGYTRIQSDINVTFVVDLASADLLLRPLTDV
jgi:hypothetical protein